MFSPRFFFFFFFFFFPPQHLASSDREIRNYDMSIYSPLFNIKIRVHHVDLTIGRFLKVITPVTSYCLFLKPLNHYKVCKGCHKNANLRLLVSCRYQLRLEAYLANMAHGCLARHSTRSLTVTWRAIKVGN